MQEQRREQRDAARARDQVGGAQPAASPRRAACACAASSVLRSSIAIVIGPTPRGTGVISAARSEAASKSTSPTSPSSTRLMPTSITVAPSLTQSPWTMRGRPTAAIEHVGAPADAGQVARARVADGHRRVARQQHLRDRLADEVGAADDDGLGALELDAVAVEQLHAARAACTAAARAGPWRAGRPTPA